MTHTYRYVEVPEGGSTASNVENVGLVQPASGATQSITLAKDYAVVVCCITSNGTLTTSGYNIKSSISEPPFSSTDTSINAHIFVFINCASGESISLTRNSAYAVRLSVYGVY